MTTIADVLVSILQAEGQPLPPVRAVIVHALTTDVFSEDAKAHVFGPFDSVEEAQLFNELDPSGDECHKAVLVIVGPAIRDVVANAVDGKDGS